ncbi:MULTISPECIES: hypothetical protein [Streptomyces]|uniref:hypothetical protein n=1 Tax=Streptomyces TaxID=1883 RepID=UPI001A8F947C|nr:MULTISPECIES: hypothetical protein [Streptomyces]MDW4901352.1 hypothetical protein [Streptomyces californicus]QSS95477.1 hypothetical protein H3V39_34025 [Streptomyces sp. M54]
MSSQITELLLTDGTTYRRGEHAPHRTISTTRQTDIPVIVRSIKDAGSRIEVHLNKGYTLAFPAARIARLVLSTGA